MADEEEVKSPSLDEVLNNALYRRYFPLCDVLEARTHDLLCKLQLDAARDGGVKESVVSAGGYCHFHFWYLHRLASPVTNGQLLEALLGKIKAALSDGHDPRSFLQGPAAQVRCPVCSLAREWEKEIVALFIAKIEAEEGFRLAYQQSRGLCIPHLGKIVDRLPGSKVAASLVMAAAGQVDLLIEELKIQTVKWRNNDRSRGEERDSTYRGIEKLVGGRNYRSG